MANCRLPDLRALLQGLNLSACLAMLPFIVLTLISEDPYSSSAAVPMGSGAALVRAVFGRNCPSKKGLMVIPLPVVLVLTQAAMWFSPSPHRFNWPNNRNVSASSTPYHPPTTKHARNKTTKYLTCRSQTSLMHTLPPPYRTPAILQAYGKKVVAAQQASNCIAAVLIPGILHSHAPQLYLPATTDIDSLSIKDCIDIKGYDTTVGYSSRANKPVPSSAPIVRLLHDAGALTHVKTTVPPGLLGVETSSDLFGRTSNPYNPEYSSGASTGGGGALLAHKGSVIEIATDIGGSARLPAHWCGVYGMKSSIGRFPSWGTVSPLPGLEGVETSCSPMARRLDDLEEFWKRVVAMRPWEYDHTCIPLPWRPVNIRGKKLRFGVIWDDGIAPPTPACRRALQMTVDALQKQGHDVIDVTPPSILEGLMIGFQLCFSDGGIDFFSAVYKDEKLDPVLTATKSLLSLPQFLKSVLARFASDPVQSAMLTSVNAKSPSQERALVVAREEYRAKWRGVWENNEWDFLVCAPHPSPAIPKGTAEKVTLVSCANMMIWNILDYTAGVLPITTVQSTLDALPSGFLNSSEYAAMGIVAKGVYAVYDASKMDSLPVGVQVVGRRLEEEKVLEGMRVIEEAVRASGISKSRNEGSGMNGVAGKSGSI
ncbi:amidase signature domain-containing protein [Pisolithus croceorrhizus]|nr:amidase signature domain-containing protein [Pisolithus croceorrhizus]